MGTQRDHARYAGGSTPRGRSPRPQVSGPDRSAGDKANDAKSPGRVVFDSRGNSVWRWDNEQDDSTSVLLKRLDNDDLALEPTRPVPILVKRAADRKSSKPEQGSDLTILDEQNGGGFDPYNRS